LGALDIRFRDLFNPRNGAESELACRNAWTT
jgi:hypothetical protein